MQETPIKMHSRIMHSPSDKENNISVVNHSIAFKTNSSAIEILNEYADNQSIIEENLTLFERITHPKWHIRRKIYIELLEEFQQKGNMPEFQQAWLKNIINDNNQFAALEGIRFIEVFVKSPQMNSHILPYFVSDLIEKGSFMKQHQLVFSILFECSRQVQDMQFVVLEIHRKFDQNHPKVILFGLKFLSQLLDNQPLTKELIKLTLKQISKFIKNTNKQIRALGIQIFVKIYSMISSSFEEVKKYLDGLRQIQIRELEQMCVHKKDHVIKIDDVQVRQIVDLNQVLPDKFYELPYYKPNDKKNKMDQFVRNLEICQNDIDANKDYSQIYNIVIQVLEESNYLLYNEGMKCVKHLVRLLKKNIPVGIAKHLFLLILDKLRGSLSKPHQSVVFNLLEDILLNETLSCDQFMEMMINQIENGKNLGMRQLCIRWFKDGWLALALAVQTKSYELSNQPLLKRFAIQNCEKIQKSLVIIYRKVSDLKKKENNLNFKKTCFELLNRLEVDENGLVRVIQDQISDEPIKETIDRRQEKKSRTVERPSRYQTEEDINEVIIDSKHQTRQSVDKQSMRQLDQILCSLQQSNLPSDMRGLISQQGECRDSKSYGSQHYSPFSTPNKSKGNFSSGEKKPDDWLTVENWIYQSECGLESLESLINHLNRGQQHVFLSPNSRSPGKHWRRGIGRENMVISTPGRIPMAAEDAIKILEFIGQHITEETLAVVTLIYEKFKKLFPNSNLIAFAYRHLCTRGVLIHDNSERAFKNVFNDLYSKHQEQSCYNLASTILPVLRDCAEIVTALVFMIEEPEYAHRLQRIPSDKIETELIAFRKLYEAYLQHQQPPTPSLQSMGSFGQQDIQKLYSQHTNNQILVVDLQQLEECETKREQTSRIEHEDSRYLHFNDYDLQLLESTTKNFQTCVTVREPENETDLLNLGEYISPVTQNSVQSANTHNNDIVLKDLARNLYSQPSVHEKSDKQKFERQSYREPTLGQQQQIVVPIKKDDMLETVYRDVQNESLVQKECAFQTLALQSRQRSDCIRQLQEILLTSTSLYFEVASALLQEYENLDNLEQKISFIMDLKVSFLNRTLLTNINEQNFMVLVAIILKLCTLPATQAEVYQFSGEENQLTKQLQLILDVLLKAKPIEQVAVTLVRIVSDHLPMDFQIEITRNEKMMIRLTLRCLERLLDAQCRTFPILLEVHKFFKYHPPEHLVEGLPSLKELEFCFRSMKTITDKIIAINSKEAKEFVQFIFNERSIYLDYVKAVVERS